MRGDAEYAGQHQHGVKDSSKTVSGAHLYKRIQPPSVPTEIRAVSISFRGHMLLTFIDGSTFELQRGDYPHNVPPKVGEFYPPRPEASVVEQVAAEAVKPKRKKKADAPEQVADNAQS